MKIFILLLGVLALRLPVMASFAPNADIGAPPDVDDVLQAIADDKFRALCREFDVDADGKLSLAEAGEVTELPVPMSGITSLEGIEYFTALILLDCSDNELTALDVSHNTELALLWCNGNRLTTIDVSHNHALTHLDCRDNELTALVSENKLLTVLDCGANRLGTLDLSKDPSLASLFCNGNHLTTLDLSHNAALTDLECSDNRLTMLNVLQNKELMSLYCYGNRLSSLDVSENTMIAELYCGGQTTDGTTARELRLTLPTDLKQMWESESANHVYNTDVILL